MRISALGATALATVALGSAPALSAFAQVAPEPVEPTPTATSTPHPTTTSAPPTIPNNGTDPTESPEPTPSPTPSSDTTITPSSVVNRGTWYQAMLNGKPAGVGSTFKASERTSSGFKDHKFITGDNGKVFHFNANRPDDTGKVADPRSITLRVVNGNVQFTDEPFPTPTPTPSPTSSPKPSDDDESVDDNGATDENGSQDDNAPTQPQPQPPKQPGTSNNPPQKRPDDGDTKQSGDRSRKSDKKQERTRDPDTGNGTIPGQAGNDWTPDRGTSETRVPNYSDPVPQNPDDGNSESEDVIVAPANNSSGGSGANPEAGSDNSSSNDTSARRTAQDASFPWTVALLIGAGALGLFLVLFVFSRRNSDDA